MEKIILIGGGGHCRSVIDVIEEEKKFSIAGIIDQSSQLGSKVFNYDVIGTDDDLHELSEKYTYALITVGQISSPDLRIKLYDLAKRSGFILPTIVSPRAHVSKYASLGSGTVVLHDALINANAHIGENCIINSKALIEHDTIVEDHCHISTGALINGGVRVEKSCFIGSGAISKEGITIKRNSFVKAGSVVK